jgi:hypothetical protein
LLLTPIPPVQVFGAFVAFGILLAFLLTVVLIPAYVVRMSPAALARLAPVKRAPASDKLLARGLRRLGHFAFGNGKMIIGVAVLMVAFSIAGVYQIQINDNPVRWFKSSHPIRVADKVLNDHFAGTYDAFLVLSYRDDEALQSFIDSADELLTVVASETASAMREALAADTSDADRYYGDILNVADDAMFDSDDEPTVDALRELVMLAEEAQSAAKYFQRPDILQHVERIQQALVKSGQVGKTNALPDVVKVVNRELRGGAADDYRIPDSLPAVAQTLLQYQSSHRPQDLWHMATPDYTSTAIWLQLSSGDNQDMSRVMQVVDDYMEGDPLPAGVTLQWAGKTFINVVWQDAMVSGMLKSLFGAFVVVLVMMSFLFRSIRLGLLAMVPLTVTIGGVYGVIGWVGKDYDMPIAVLSSLTLGLSIDFAIHFIQRMRSLMRQTGTFRDAAAKMFEEPARAIARNAIVIAIGFTPLFFAPLVPYITVGAFMAAIMALSAVSTLILLPALIGVAGRWFFPEARKEGVFDAPLPVASGS